MERMEHMERAAWSEALAVGVAKVDEQHRRLIAMINEALDHIEQKKPNTDLVFLIKKLFAYAEEHFATEDQYMTAHGYPGQAAHLDEHARYRKEVQVFNLDHVLQMPHVAHQILRFLWEWLRQHIAQTDKKMGVFLTGRGLR